MNRLAAAAFLGLLLGACATGAAPELHAGGLCFVDADCPPGLACLNQTCQPLGSAAMGELGESDDDGGADDGEDDGTGSEDDGSEPANASDDGDEPLPDPGDDGAAEPPDPGDDGSDPGECLEEGVSCESSSQCCGHTEDPIAGDGVCISRAGEGAECTTWCDVNGDCPSSCCGGVSDSDLGACLPEESCAEFYACVDGVKLYCSCAVLAGEECSDAQIQQHVQSCASAGGNPYFECMGPHWVDTEDLAVLDAACDGGVGQCGGGPASGSGTAPATFDIDELAAAAVLAPVPADLKGN